MPKRLLLVDAPKQELQFTDAGVTHTITLTWNGTVNAWFASLAVMGVQLISGSRVVIGVDVFKAYRFGTLYARNASDNDLTLTRASLINGNARLYWYTPDELANLKGFLVIPKCGPRPLQPAYPDIVGTTPEEYEAALLLFNTDYPVYAVALATWAACDFDKIACPALPAPLVVELDIASKGEMFSQDAAFSGQGFDGWFPVVSQTRLNELNNGVVTSSHTFDDGDEIDLVTNPYNPGWFAGPTDNARLNQFAIVAGESSGLQMRLIRDAINGTLGDPNVRVLPYNDPLLAPGEHIRLHWFNNTLGWFIIPGTYSDGIPDQATVDTYNEQIQLYGTCVGCGDAPIDPGPATPPDIASGGLFVTRSGDAGAGEPAEYFHTDAPFVSGATYDIELHQTPTPTDGAPFNNISDGRNLFRLVFAGNTNPFAVHDFDISNGAEYNFRNKNTLIDINSISDEKLVQGNILRMSFNATNNGVVNLDDTNAYTEGLPQQVADDYQAELGVWRRCVGVWEAPAPPPEIQDGTFDDGTLESGGVSDSETRILTNNTGARMLLTAADTLGKTSGVWYWEYEYITGAANAAFGVVNYGQANTFAPPTVPATLGFNPGELSFFSEGTIFSNQASLGNHSGFLQGNTVLGFVLDLDNNTLDFYIDGVLSNIGSAGPGINSLLSNSATPWLPAFMIDPPGQVRFNTKADDMVHPVPPGSLPIASIIE